MGPYSRRLIDGMLDDLVPALPAVAIEGAKAVGKTATAMQRSATIRRLDDPETAEIAAADPSSLFAGAPPVLLDEWQNVPTIWNSVRRAVDDGAPAGSFVLTGSAAPVPGRGLHSGAGRIVGVRMRPLTMAERFADPPTVSVRGLLDGGREPIVGTTSVDLRRYIDEIVASGFPGLRSLTGRPLGAALDGYLSRIVDRDFAELGHQVRNAPALRRWMRAYAAATATTATWETIRDAATGGEAEKPSKAATLPYRDILERLFILDPVPGWKPTQHHIAELGDPPKHHLADPALAARLLGVDTQALLTGHVASPAVPRDGTLLGALFESLVTLSIRVYAELAEANVGHLRTYRGGHEIDLIVERPDGRVVAFEVKLGGSIQDSAVRHLAWLREQIGDNLIEAIVVTTGTQAYRRADGIAVVPAALLGP